MSPVEEALWRIQAEGTGIPDKAAFYADIELIRKALQQQLTPMEAETILGDAEDSGLAIYSSAWKKVRAMAKGQS
jgi:hypothetical protein